MNEKTKELLRKAGWYEGRSIEEMVKFCEDGKANVFPKAKEFLREFGGLTIFNEDMKYEHTTKLDELHLSGYDRVNSVCMTNLLKENVLEVGMTDNENLYLYISESGKIYDDRGKIGDDMYKAWNYILRTMPKDECRSQFISWSKLGIK